MTDYLPAPNYGSAKAVVALADTDGAPLGTAANPLAISALDAKRATYGSSTVALAVTQPGVILQIQGSATKIIRITDVIVSAIATAASVGVLSLLRTTTTSGGTGAAVTPCSYDSTNPAATAAVLQFATPGSLGTGALGLRNSRLPIGVSTKGEAPVFFYFGAESDQAVVLRGTSEFAGLYFACPVFTGMNVDVSLTWTESAT